MKQPSLFTDEVFKRQMVLEHVMEHVEQSKTIFNWAIALLLRTPPIEDMGFFPPLPMEFPQRFQYF